MNFAVCLLVLFLFSVNDVPTLTSHCGRMWTLAVRQCMEGLVIVVLDIL